MVSDAKETTVLYYVHSYKQNETQIALGFKKVWLPKETVPKSHKTLCIIVHDLCVSTTVADRTSLSMAINGILLQ